MTWKARGVANMKADVIDPSRVAHAASGQGAAFALIFDEIFRSIAQKGRGTAAPFLAVLGPTGSGKSQLLYRIEEYLNSRPPPAAYCHIRIDLRSSALTDSNQMHFDLARKIHAQAEHHGAVAPLQVTRDNARSTFVTYIREMLRSIDKYVIIYVDHSDYVPRYFARSLATQFRDILEKEDLYPELKRLGLVWSGAMSLFGLKQEVDSAFSMCKTIVTPASAPALRELLVRDHLKRCGIDAPPDFVVGTLAAQTGAEPAFLDPAVRMLWEERNRRPSKTLVSRVLNHLSDPSRTPIPELKEVALNVRLDRDLRDIVDRLLNGLQVPCREPAVDVDQYHLKGAVIVDGGTSRAGYIFRNDLMKQFLRNLLGQPASKQVRQAERDDSGVLPFPGPLNEIDKLNRLDERLEQCFDLKSATSLAVEAWSLLTNHGKPMIAFCLQASKLIWFAPLGGEPTDNAPSATASEAAQGALTFDRAYFASDDQRVSVALPLQYERNMAVVAVTVDRSRLRVGLSEMSIHHWVQFVMAHEARLIILCLSALGFQHIVEMEAGSPDENAQVDITAAFVHISCFAYDCRGNPIADATIAFESVDGEARTLLGEILTTEDRARPATIVIPRDANEEAQIEITARFAGQNSKLTKLDLRNSWSCEFVFHVDDEEDIWASRKRRTGWRCRHPECNPETRCEPALVCIGLRGQSRARVTAAASPKARISGLEHSQTQRRKK